MSKPVTRKRVDRVLEVTLDRPPVNAITMDVSNALYEAFAELRDDDELRVGIITGAGDKVFSAGWDLKEAAQLSSETVDDASAMPGGFAGITEFWDLYKPVISALNGATIGGGFEIALATDIIIAAEHVEFWLPEMQLGFLADAGAVQRLPRRLPYNVAMELLLTGRHMDAAEGKHWGLVHEVVPADALIPRARELAASIAEGAPLALQALKEVVPAIVNLPVEQAFARMKRDRSNLPIYEKMMSSEDMLEGSRAFAEKRKPVWKGR